MAQPPANRSRSTPTPAVPPADGAQPLAGRRVLVVDDEPAVARGFAALVLMAGGEATPCHDARKAVGEAEQAILGGRPFDLALVDLVMPRVDGEALIQRLRGLHPPPVILVVSGANQAAQAIRCLRVGAADYLTKPVDGEHLLASIRKVLAARSAPGAPPSGAHGPLAPLVECLRQQPSLPDLDTWKDLLFREVLRREEGNQTRAAAILGLTRQTMNAVAQRLKEADAGAT